MKGNSIRFLLDLLGMWLLAPSLLIWALIIATYTPGLAMWVILIGLSADFLMSVQMLDKSLD